MFLSKFSSDSHSMKAKANPNTKYDRLRSRLLLQGYTIRSWALKHGHQPNTVYQAAKGKRNGVKSVPIRRQLEEFCA